MVDAKTKLCILIGNPVEHSLSPAIHNAAFSALGLNFVYTAHRVEDVEAAVKGLRALGLRGASVTIPHKLAVIPFLDEVDPVAAGIGAVNTIVNDQGRLQGFNTDGEGAIKALVEAGVKLEGKRALIIGSGGAARAVGFTLAAKARIGSLTILGIIEPELTKLAGDIADQTPVQAIGKLLTDRVLAEETATAELLLQCSPIGMHPKVDETPVPAKLLRKKEIEGKLIPDAQELLATLEAQL